MPDSYQQRPLTGSMGLNTSQNAAAISDDELREAVGCEYLLGSPHLEKQPGRSLAATLPGASQVVRAVQQLQYDSVASVLAAYGGDGALYESAVSLAPSFSSSGLVVPGAAVPHFNSYSDQWLMCVGQGFNFLREPTPPTPNTGYSGHWRPSGMFPAFGTTAIEIVAAPAAAPANEHGWGSTVSGFQNMPLAFDSTTSPDYRLTYAEGIVGRTYGSTATATWTYTTSTTSVTNKSIEITWANGGYDQRNQPSGASYSTFTLEVDNGSGTYETVVTTGTPNAASTISVPVASGLTNLQNNLKVRATVTGGLSNTLGVGRVHDLRLVDSGTTNTTANPLTNPVTYLVTERFYDGNGVIHESQGNQFSVPQSLDGAYAVKVYLPGISSTGTGTTTRTNPTSTQFVIYRSIAESGGGYPYMWEIATVDWTSTNGGGGAQTYYQDTFQLSLTTNADKNHLYDVIQVLYPDGSILFFPMNAPPPISSMSLVYQGAVVYWPVDQPSRLFYSMPASISSRAAEQVPAVYYLDFQTPTSDTAVSGTLCNGGRSLIVYFPAYTMLVNYLPQAQDPGVFDQRVKEYVSQVRGAAGRFCAASISLPSGGQLAIAADSLGVWATDGVSGIQDWTKDISWGTTAKDGLMDGVDLSTAQFRDNPELRRLELLYTNLDDEQVEMHFFYGDFKPNGLPKVTGPHPAGNGTSQTGGWISAHYSHLDSTPRQWVGWKGSGYTDGKVFLERMTTAAAACYSDASHAYDILGKVPYIATTGDQYMAGLGQSAVVEIAVPKFMPGVQKDITIVSTFYRDGNDVEESVTKIYSTNERSKVYLHRYCDRHRVSIRDISSTRGTALVAWNVYYRPLGPSKDQAPTV